MEGKEAWEEWDLRRARGGLRQEPREGRRGWRHAGGSRLEGARIGNENRGVRNYQN